MASPPASWVAFFIPFKHSIRAPVFGASSAQAGLGSVYHASNKKCQARNGSNGIYSKLHAIVPMWTPSSSLTYCFCHCYWASGGTALPQPYVQSWPAQCPHSPSTPESRSAVLAKSPTKASLFARRVNDGGGYTRTRTTFASAHSSSSSSSFLAHFVCSSEPFLHLSLSLDFVITCKGLETRSSGIHRVSSLDD